MLRRIVLTALTVSLLCAPSAHAAAIFEISDPATNAFLAIAFDAAGDPETFVVIDLDGAAPGNIFDDVAAADLGPAVATVLEPSNTVSLTTVLGELTIEFLFDSAVFGAVGTLTLNGTGSAVLLDADLAGFVGPVVGTFGFALAQEIPQVGVANIYQLERIIGPGSDVTAVPEPASLTLLGIGLAAAARRRKMRK